MTEYGLKLWRLEISPLEPPRRVAQQVHHDNFEGNSPTYFKQSVGLPALPSILRELHNRFEPKQKMVSRLLVSCNTSSKPDHYARGGYT